jgi:preprotein translocase subunit SecE
MRVPHLPVFPVAVLLSKQVLKDGNGFMAKTSPGEFIRQVRAETAKVSWPTGRETGMTVVMVIIMTTILGLFFLGVDSVFSWIVKTLLSLAS